MFPTLQHPVAGAHRVTGTPVKLSETPGGTGAAAPLLGEHTSETLSELLGLDDATLDALRARGVIHEIVTRYSMRRARTGSPAAAFQAGRALAIAPMASRRAAALR